MESGSVEEVTERLKSWWVLYTTTVWYVCGVGFSCVRPAKKWSIRLKKSLPVVEIDLPPGEAGYETASRLIEKLQSRSGSVVSITGIEWAFPEGGNRLETLVALSFQRETLAALPVRQIWWVPSSMTERFVLGVPDLDSWFRLKLHLTEAPPVRAVERTEGKTVSFAEARTVARRFWERLESARAQNVPEERIWTELAQPAVDALRSAGLEFEANRILASIPEARERLERNLDDVQSRRGRDDLEVMDLSEQLADLLGDQGDLAGARRLQERVVDVRTRVLGEEHPDTLNSMNNLAEILRDHGDHAAARRLQEQVLAVAKRVLGEEHPDTLISMNNLALTLGEQGDHAGARRLQEQVLAIEKRVLGEEDPDTLRSMNNLAGTLRAQGDYAGARHIEERVLEVSTRVLGGEHPDTLTSMGNLALTLWEQGDHAGARRLEERVMEVSTRVLGEEHPNTLLSMNNLAATLWDQGEDTRALALLRKCLAGQRKVLGEDHPHTFANVERLRDWEEQLIGLRPPPQF